MPLRGEKFFQQIKNLRFSIVVGLTAGPQRRGIVQQHFVAIESVPFRAEKNAQKTWTSLTTKGLSGNSKNIYRTTVFPQIVSEETILF